MTTRRRDDVGVFIFSFNRGDHLDVCLHSVLANVPARAIRVFDDGSDDPATLAVLRHWESSLDVVYADRGPTSGSNRGGLHRNMERALAFARDEGITWALMLQDDMQVVRRVDDDDVRSWHGVLEANENMIELYVTFDVYHAASPHEWFLDLSGFAFLPRRPHLVDAYSATGLFHVGRYWERLGRFEASEFENTQALFARGFVKGRHRTPLTMFTPYPRTTRWGWNLKGMKGRIAEFLAGSGVHPFDVMSDEAVDRLRATALEAPPLAREWLVCPSMTHREKWSYFGGPRDLRACGGARTMVGRLLGGKAPREGRDTA